MAKSNEIYMESFYSYKKSEIGEYVKFKKTKYEPKFREFRFEITKETKPLWVPIKDRAPIRHIVTPDTLVQLCCHILKKIPLPSVFSWGSEDIFEWLKELELPQYMTTFFENHITGHNLLFLDVNDLQAMNIKKFEDIIKIVTSIRKLYGIEKIKFSRNISLPTRKPLTLYYNYHGHKGYKFDNESSYGFLRLAQLIEKPPSYEQHWDILHKNLTNRRWSYENNILFGYCPKYQLYRTKYVPKLPLNRTNVKKNVCKCGIHCVMCCKCNYGDINFNTGPFTYLHLINLFMQARINLGENCDCKDICYCYFNNVQPPETLTLLKKIFPEKYQTAAIHNTIPQDTKKSSINKGSRKSILSRKPSRPSIPN